MGNQPGATSTVSQESLARLHLPACAQWASRHSSSTHAVLIKGDGLYHDASDALQFRGCWGILSQVSEGNSLKSHLPSPYSFGGVSVLAL